MVKQSYTTLAAYYPNSEGVNTRQIECNLTELKITDTIDLRTFPKAWKGRRIKHINVRKNEEFTIKYVDFKSLKVRNDLELKEGFGAFDIILDDEKSHRFYFKKGSKESNYELAKFVIFIGLALGIKSICKAKS